MKTKKILSLLLAAALLLPVTGCGESEVNSDAPTPAENSAVQEPAAEEAAPDEDARPMHQVPDSLDFDGGSFNVVYPDWQGYKYYFFADESTGDAMNDAIFDRKVTVEDYLNVSLTQYTPGYIEAIAPAVKQSVTSADDSYQLALTHCIQDVANLATGGYLYNYDKLPYVDYLAPWWNREMMDVLRLGQNTYYGVSDYMIPCPYAIFFNKGMIADFQLDNPYELVYNGEWTVDKFMELATAATQDTNGDGKFTKDDYRGVGVEEVSKWISFMTGSGQFMTDRDEEGHIRLALNTDKMQTLVEKFAAFASQTGVIVSPDNSMSVADGTLLFELHTIAHAVEYRDTEVDIGILPYPKFDTEQENYISLDWGGLMGVPTSIANPELVGAVLELLAYESGNEVIPTYYDVLLDGKLARDTDTVAMIDILFDTICYEVGGNYFGFDGGFGDFFYTIARLAVTNKSTDLASWIKTREKPVSKVIERFYKTLDETESAGE